jgi:hypothetical protein
VNISTPLPPPPSVSVSSPSSLNRTPTVIPSTPLASSSGGTLKKLFGSSSSLSQHSSPLGPSSTSAVSTPTVQHSLSSTSSSLFSFSSKENVNKSSSTSVGNRMKLCEDVHMTLSSPNQLKDLGIEFLFIMAWLLICLYFIFSLSLGLIPGL